MVLVLSNIVHVPSSIVLGPSLMCGSRGMFYAAIGLNNGHVVVVACTSRSKRGLTRIAYIIMEPIVLPSQPTRAGCVRFDRQKCLGLLKTSGEIISQDQKLPAQ